MQGGPDAITIACVNFDRLSTVEMRRSDYSRGVIANLHAAACEAQGGGPLSLLGVAFLQEKVLAGRRVLITTGAGHPKHLPAGETDGPPGATQLARLVCALGGVPILLTGQEYVENLAATALAAGLGLRMPEVAKEVGFTTAVLRSPPVTMPRRRRRRCSPVSRRACSSRSRR
jgi:hypothetical protein